MWMEVERGGGMIKRLFKLSYAIVVVSLLFTQLSLAESTASFSITYVSEGDTDHMDRPCYNFPEEAKLPFEAAANIWANIIQSEVPITIRACWADLGGGAVGADSGGWTIFRNFTNVPYTDTWYVKSLANALRGSDLNPSLFDMHITYNLNKSWYYGTDGNVPSNQADLMSVALHEIAHGLSFTGLMEYSGGVGRWGIGTGYPSIYEIFMRDGSGNQLIDTAVYPNPSTALGSALTSDNIWFHGSNAMAVNGGDRVKIHVPLTWEKSSYTHLGTTFDNTVNQLMVRQVSEGESVHDPGPVTIGLLQDLGWQTFYSRSAIDGFNPNIPSNQVYSIAVQADGKILIGGWFTAVGGVPRNNIARLNADGTVDTGFNPIADNIVYSIAVQADGKILLGGSFTTVGGETKSYIARLNGGGSLDADFNPVVDKIV
jgi:uncharacterized delta-60 repeat protein